MPLPRLLGELHIQLAAHFQRANVMRFVVLLKLATNASPCPASASSLNQLDRNAIRTTRPLAQPNTQLTETTVGRTSIAFVLRSHDRRAWVDDPTLGSPVRPTSKGGLCLFRNSVTERTVMEDETTGRVTFRHIKIHVTRNG